ncbi:MAG: hypothetical protein LBU67_05850 [Oscillospiraceae bacterium]|nr:hypothetical protein [Oscillospiraceae bacterium]
MKKVLVILALVVMLVICTGAAARAEDAAAVGAPIDLTQLAAAVVTVVVLVLQRWLIPWLHSKLRGEKAALYDGIVRTLVYGAEQMYKTGAVQDRLAWVEEQLCTRGFAIDKACIEAIVTELRINQGKGVQAPAVQLHAQAEAEAAG